MAIPTSTQVAIIGAGFGGLGFGICLKRRLGCEDFMIFEKGSDIGGTWRDNTYPGCGSDVAIHWYSLSTDLKPDWRASHGTQPEILNYMLDVTAKYGLREHCVFNTTVVSATWDKVQHVYIIVTKNLHTGETKETHAKILISAIGALSEPRMPDIPGIDDFRGDGFHSARWNHGVDLRGKRVAVIGNGCSAAQFMPLIAQDASTQIVQFCRTPMWYRPRDEPLYSAGAKWIFAHVPFAMRMHRYSLALGHEVMYIFMHFNRGSFADYVKKTHIKYIKAVSPAEYVDELTPSYPPGCKRFILDAGYLKALHRPNIILNWDEIERIAENGIVTKKGKHLPFDVIIYATGFQVAAFTYELCGSQGGTLHKYWKDHRGPTAYLGTTVPGFPNFSIIGGPNTGTGHASQIFTEEVQINYALKLYEPVLSGALSSVEPTNAATDAYNEAIQRRLSTSVWSSCTSWYRSGATGKIFSIFPGPVSLFWWYLRPPKWADYRVEGEGKRWWVAKRRIARLLRVTVYVVGLASVSAAGRLWMHGSFGAMRAGMHVSLGAVREQILGVVRAGI